MNGVVEEGSKVAVSTVGALSSSPAILALVLLQFAFIAGNSYLTFQRENHVERRFNVMMKYCASQVSALKEK